MFADLSSLATFREIGDDRENGAALAVGAAAALAALPLLRATLCTPAERVLARAEAIIFENKEKAKERKDDRKKVCFSFLEIE